MTLRFLKLEWKQFVRSASFGKSIALKIIMGFFALYFLVSFLAIGIGGYFILKKEFPASDPLQLVNSYLLFAILGDLILRYLMQTLPIMNIKPMLTLPIKKSKLVHFVLGKSSFSFFNILGLFFYIPFAIVLIKEGYQTAGVLGWLLTMILIIQSANFINFLINKNNVALVFIVGLFVILIGLQKFKIVDVVSFGGQIFDAIYVNPIFSLISVVLLLVLYWLNYKQLRNQVYLDEAVAAKVEEANTSDLSWADKLGDVAPFIKNDIRLIWRNKRTKTVFLMSFLFLFYGLIFYTMDAYKDSLPMLMFASLFVTGGFTLNYGQFIPAWDSAHYKMLMSQSFRYRKFLESKWVLMVSMTTILYFLSFPYLYFGIDIFLMITAGAIFNIGFNSLFLLYAGSFNRKRIDLTKGGFGNTQGTSATQFLVVIPLMLFPMLLFWVFNTYVGYNSGFIIVASIGLISLLLKNYAMNFIEKKYIKDKYAMINAFGKEA
ncbi:MULTISPECIES: DUF5687 family protein [unclassified Polaribacter]|jgi:hypothetical protein|uniref:DUF5687 family protein n=3 Tax=Polaribacter TaxID=52959 RepID=UPI00052CFC86|nr:MULTISPECIES: DUF5687 family protein [unclassified Polaribacter]KGL60181.1 conserved hypothetical membrane protein [Polaribacter sp. Hel1_33_49]PKV66191.1 hypothetical protein ATE90_2650 [Polaribacter sp. Hel1_33_96]